MARVSVYQSRSPEAVSRAGVSWFGTPGGMLSRVSSQPLSQTTSPSSRWKRTVSSLEMSVGSAGFQSFQAATASRLSPATSAGRAAAVTSRTRSSA